MKAKYFTKFNDTKVQCHLCPRECKLMNGQRGICYVRKNDNGDLYLTTYGLASGFAVDPIEKKPLFHFYPGSDVLSFGTIGCNLKCSFCQNWEISTPVENLRLINASPDLISNKVKELNLNVAYTYNEPIISSEYIEDVSKLVKEAGFKNIAVTAGYINKKPRENFFRHIDAVNIDLKAFSDDFYMNFTKAHLDPVLDTIKYLKNETNVWLEITTLVIPGVNDNLARMFEWGLENLGDQIPWHLSAYRPSHKYNESPVTKISLLKKIRQLAISMGLKYVYTGNVIDNIGSTTYCSVCKKVLIERDVSVRLLGIESGKCNNCGSKVVGVFL